MSAGEGQGRIGERQLRQVSEIERELTCTVEELRRRRFRDCFIDANYTRVRLVTDQSG